MNFFTFTKLGRVMLFSAAVAMFVGTVSAQKLIGTAQGRHERSDDDRRDRRRNETLTDRRDGQQYRIVKIGGQMWTAENMNYRTGTSWCYGDNNSNCEKYGRLYDWNTAMTVCPKGWRLPSREEWGNLAAAAGGVSKALKSTSGWVGNSNGTDDFGFSALPGGCRNNPGSFANYNDAGWWTATEGGNGNSGAYQLWLHIRGFPQQGLRFLCTLRRRQLTLPSPH